MAAAEVPPDFGDSSPEDAVFNAPATWRDHVPNSTSTATETNPVKVGEIATQTGTKGEIGVQTDEGGGVMAEPPKAEAAGISKFLAKMEGLMSGELVKSVEEHDAMEPFTRQADDTQDPATCLHYLSAFTTVGETQDLNATSSQTNKSRLVVTSVSWSSTGQTIAASYGRYDIVGWCTYPGMLVTWNLGRELNSSKPDLRIDTDTCLMACAFHPAQPALIAGGTFNGELLVWDLSKEGDTQVGRSDVLMDVRHTEPIVTMTWQYNLTDAAKYGTKDKSYRLVTLGADGRVLIWQWHNMVTPIYGYHMLWPQPGADRKFVWGGSCMSFQREPKVARKEAGGSTGGEAAGTFLVGSEGGRIFKCYSDVNDINQKDFAKAVATGERVDLRCPIKDTGFVPHPGSVFGVDCSPFMREIFLTCGTDGSVRLYNSMQKQPLLHLEPTSSYLYSVQWSPFRPLVFATTAADGCVYFYDLMRTRDIVKPMLTLDTNGLRKPTYALAFNPKKPELLATGDSTGIQIWRLPSQLTDVRRGEEGFLKKIAVAGDVNELLRNAQ